MDGVRRGFQLLTMDVECEFVTKRYVYDIFPEKPDGICSGLVGVFF